MKKLLMVMVLVLIPVIIFGQESNPDGIVGKPSFTLLGGFGTGDIKQHINGIDAGTVDLKSYGVKLEVLYPLSKSASFIFQVNISKENQNSPETLDFYKMKSDLTGYGFVVGVRLFSHGK